MLRALRVVSVERGHDPRDFALVAFGGAGPLHACELAEELGIETVLVPEAAGVLSALGLAASDERRDRVQSYVVPLARGRRASGRGRGGPPLRGAVVRADGAARRRPRPRRSTGRTRSGTATLDRDRPIELVAVRTAEVRPARASSRAGRPVKEVAGPAVLELDGSTCWLPLGWVGVRDGATLEAHENVNIELQVLGSALRSVAEEMGAVLVRSSFSANIKERRDCSAALFDERGRMIAQAEHIPVHLGAMPDAVAAVMAESPAARRRLRPQRPLRRRHAPPGHHARLPHRGRLRRHARPPRRRRRLASRGACRPTRARSPTRAS